MKARAILLAGVLALSLAHAGTMPMPLSNLLLDVMREYPTAGRPAPEVRARCEDVAGYVQRIYVLRLRTRITLAETHGLIDEMLLSGEIDAKRDRYVKDIATYVYAQPEPAERVAQGARPSANDAYARAGKTLHDSTLAACRTNLEH